MLDIFILKLILSFIVGAAYTIISTVIADKLGSKIGGLVTALPSTALFGLLFIGWTQNANASVEATTLMPAVLGLSCLFLIVYLLLVNYSIWLGLGGGLFIWGICAYILLVFKINNFFVSVLIFILLYGLGYFFVTRVFKIIAKQGNIIKYSPVIFLLRGLISGFIIALAVIVAKIGGPIVGGVFSAFPAMFTSILLITYRTHGATFSSSIAKNSLISLVTIFVFILVARYTFLPFGLIGGSLLALIASYISAYFLYNNIVKKHA